MRGIEKVVVDFSALKEGVLSKDMGAKFTSKSVYIHEAVVSYVESLARQKRETGFICLGELSKIADMSRKMGFELVFTGKDAMRRDPDIESLSRDLAFDVGATLVTTDPIQAKIASAKSIDVMLSRASGRKRLALESFFDDRTMSVHIREGTEVSAKKGAPGKWDFVKLSSKKMAADEIRAIAQEIVEEAGIRDDGFIEIENKASTIVQLGNFRIVITYPPFSDGWEITAVRPVRLLDLAEYLLPKEILERLEKSAEGILISGSPGEGKTTFARALALHYASLKKVVKTVESPRDMILPPEITQYALSHSSSKEIHDILLLTRPDYTIFDEMRDTDDFRFYSDMRLAGVGMVGIIHASAPIDSVQRFIGRIELGVIPQIIDTVIFIKGGAVEKIFEIAMTVKIPAGMQDADLARPIVVVRDFMTKETEYEMYSYGEDTVVVPVTKVAKLGETKVMQKLAAETLEKRLSKYSKNAKVEVISEDRCKLFVPENEIPLLIGKGGENIKDIEREMGIGIDVEKLPSGFQKVEFDVGTDKRHITIVPRINLVGRDVDIYIEDEFVLSAQVGKKNIIKIQKESEHGKTLFLAHSMDKRIELRL